MTFAKGDRIVENARAPRSTRRIRDGVFRTGTVVGFSGTPGVVRVRFDHIKAIYGYHVSFLDHAEESE
jgi:ribosomal protein L35AE/L33A